MLMLRAVYIVISCSDDYPEELSIVAQDASEFADLLNEITQRDQQVEDEVCSCPKAALCYQLQGQSEPLSSAAGAHNTVCHSSGLMRCLRAI
jgi:hypothetical protein